MSGFLDISYYFLIQWFCKREGENAMVLSARHRWPEAAGFTLHRPAGLDNYTFLHFHV